MTLSQSLFVIGLLIAASAFFSMAEISLAAARRLRLRQMADEGDPRADRVLRMQEQPGDYFTVVQVGQNAVAILGGIVGEGALSPHFGALFALWFSQPLAEKAGFLASFLVITSLFILFADLFPKRLGMANPERLAVSLAAPMACFERIDDYIGRNLRQDIDIEELARQAKMSLRSLYALFERHASATPRQYIRQRKLERIHACLADPSCNVRSVTELALDYGFLHLGRFSESYRQQFGELPSETLKRRG